MPGSAVHARRPLHLWDACHDEQPQQAAPATPPRHHPPTHTAMCLQTGEALPVLNTEQQIAEAKQQMEEDLEADAELLGLKRKKKPAAAAAAAEAAAPAAEGSDVAAADGSAAAAAAGGDAAGDELVSCCLVLALLDSIRLGILDINFAFSNREESSIVAGHPTCCIFCLASWVGAGFACRC